MKNIYIIQRVACDYRKEFYHLLHSKLSSENVSLIICSGYPWPGEALVEILEEINVGVRLKNIKIGGNAYWQKGVLKTVRNADLVIFEQANSALVNYYLILKRKLGGKTKTAYWGHGAHLGKTKPHPIRDALKKWLIDKADWWFAYTELSAIIVREAGFPSDRVTVLNNSIDTVSLSKERSRLTDADLNALRKELFPSDDQTKTNHPTGVYCGRLSKLKMIPFLLENIERINKTIPEFRMVVVGDGVDHDKMEAFASHNDWVAWVGPRHGLDRVKYLALGDVWLNPGMVGLSILDSFSLGIPLLTTDNHTHSPEIIYLQHGINGLMTENNLSSYANAVIDLLQNKTYLARLRTGALNSSKLYTCEAMAENFKNGVMKCLAI